MSKSQGFSWSHLMKQGIKKPSKAPLPLSLKISTRPHFPATPSATQMVARSLIQQCHPERRKTFWRRWREKSKENESRGKRAGLDTKDIDREDEEDYMGVMPLIEKLEKEKLKDTGDLNLYEEPTNSDSDEDDERFTPDAVKKSCNID
ncbi:hypothetical protein ACFX2I_014980 [Malus domestica]